MLTALSGVEDLVKQFSKLKLLVVMLSLLLKDARVTSNNFTYVLIYVVALTLAPTSYSNYAS